MMISELIWKPSIIRISLYLITTNHININNRTSCINLSTWEGHLALETKSLITIILTMKTIVFQTIWVHWEEVFITIKKVIILLWIQQRNKKSPITLFLFNKNIRRGVLKESKRITSLHWQMRAKKAVDYRINW
jgi:hypothetical protein